MTGIRPAAATTARPRSDRTPRLLRITVCSLRLERHLASRHSVSAPLRAGHGNPWQTARRPPGRHAAGELLAFGVADFPAAGTIDAGLAGISARTWSRIWNQWPRWNTWSTVPSVLTRTAVSAL